MLLPPLRDIFDELNYRVVQPLMPVLQELAEDLLPVLGMALGSAADMVGPLADAFMPLLTDILRVRLVGIDAGRVDHPAADRYFASCDSGTTADNSARPANRRKYPAGGDPLIEAAGFCAVRRGRAGAGLHFAGAGGNAPMHSALWWAG